jgi:hypothetical protein
MLFKKQLQHVNLNIVISIADVGTCAWLSSEQTIKNLHCEGFGHVHN